MTATTPTYELTSTFDTDDLQALTKRPAPFVTVCLQAPTTHDQDEYRFAMAWNTVRRTVEAEWSPDLLAALDEHIAGLDHGNGEAVVIVQSSDGQFFTEFLPLGIAESRADIGDQPRLIGVIEHRQRTLPHVVVETDRSGADIVAFDQGRVISSEQVEGETFQIHRGHPGGWSQHRFQQRAENTWETNADDVAASTIEVAERIGAVAVMVAGEIRARSLVTDALIGHDFQVVNIEEGDTDGIADAVLRNLSDIHARNQQDIIQQLRNLDASSTTVSDVQTALEQGQVETLLVNDRPTDDSDRSELDAAIASALAHGAQVVVLPTVAEMSDGLASINRW